MLIANQQSKMARAALDWGVKDLSLAAGIGINTVTRFESGRNVTIDTIQKIQVALETAGIEFIPANGGGPGVRLRANAD